MVVKRETSPKHHDDFQLVNVSSDSDTQQISDTRVLMVNLL